MRNPERITQILSVVARVWAKYPDLRLGQLLVNLEPEIDLYYIEDEDLIRELENRYR